VSSFGKESLKNFFQNAGKLAIFVLRLGSLAFSPPLRGRLILSQMLDVGTRSLPIALVASAFCGMVLVVHAVSILHKFGAEMYIGSLVTVAITRELGPVLIAIVTASRVTAAITAELGSMKLSEQIDALTTMAVNPIKYLGVPRVIAAIIMMPVLVIIADFTSIFAGYLVSLLQTRVDSSVYIISTLNFLNFRDIWTGLVKAAIFGGIMATIGCYFGFETRGGAKGLGQATTQAVVSSAILILVANYFLAVILYLL
jgi:phospholipid/cholesterol/gamma-HCH transport system permease protein